MNSLSEKQLKLLEELKNSQKAIPTERFAIAHNPNFKRFLRSASLSHSQHPQTAIPAERFAIAHNPLILSDRNSNLFLKCDRSQPQF